MLPQRPRRLGRPPKQQRRQRHHTGHQRHGSSGRGGHGEPVDQKDGGGARGAVCSDHGLLKHGAAVVARRGSDVGQRHAGLRHEALAARRHVVAQAEGGRSQARRDVGARVVHSVQVRFFVPVLPGGVARRAHEACHAVPLVRVEARPARVVGSQAPVGEEATRQRQLLDAREHRVVQQPGRRWAAQEGSRSGAVGLNRGDVCERHARLEHLEAVPADGVVPTHQL
mmetsp:Transcript_34044/g.89376  ORF Transcript_34044/g.89376 Transcript_34044/m.89376 type:complete len:226 (-) Transcript_34044:395-1072(-)